MYFPVDSHLSSLCYQSLTQVTDSPQTQVMIQGLERCRYTSLSDALNCSGKVRRIFLSAAYHSETSLVSTIEGRKIKQLDFEPGYVPFLYLTNKLYMKRKCKAAITNHILENYKRHVEKLPLIPIIFCIGITKGFLLDPKTVATKNPNPDHQFSNAELRRCYKLCHESENGGLEEIAVVAKQSLFFVTVKLDESCQITRTVPFWETEKWTELWQERKSAQRKSSPKADEFDWRKQFAKEICPPT